MIERDGIQINYWGFCLYWFCKKKNKNINCFSVSKLIFSYDPPFWLMPTVYAYICVLKACIATQCRSVQRGVQRGAFSPTSGATPATPTLGATPKFLSATPKDFVPSEKAKRSLLLLQNIWSISIWKGGKLKKLHVPRSGASFYNVQCICSEIVLLVIAKITYYQSANLCSAFRYAFF